MPEVETAIVTVQDFTSEVVFSFTVQDYTSDNIIIVVRDYTNDALSTVNIVDFFRVNYKLTL
jgi:hypothetical protein